jgi:DNA (cytosine-5)-methyltransferase 1
VNAPRDPGAAYRARLDDLWARHQAPRLPGAPSVISTFAGCGGSSLGYSAAGFLELLAVEIEPNAASTFRRNFPDVAVFEGDIAQLTVAAILNECGLEVGQLDVLDGSPPCQGFSTAGLRIMEDPRNQLFREYVRLLRGLQPKAFLMENVSGMVKGPMREIFVEILKELKASGYRVRAMLMDAQWYGVPQIRKRMIFLGIREDLGIEPEFPAPERFRVTCRDAIGHIPAGQPGPHHPRVLEAWRLAKPHQDLRKSRMKAGSYQSAKLDPTRPSRTQTASHMHWRWDVARQLTRDEAALLMSFPSQFHFHASRNDYTRRIGNAVPPLLAEALALALRKAILTVEPIPTP